MKPPIQSKPIQHQTEFNDPERKSMLNIGRIVKSISLPTQQQAEYSSEFLTWSNGSIIFPNTPDVITLSPNVIVNFSRPRNTFDYIKWAIDFKLCDLSIVIFGKGKLSVSLLSIGPTDIHTPLVKKSVDLDNEPFVINIDFNEFNKLNTCRIGLEIECSEQSADLKDILWTTQDPRIEYTENLPGLNEKLQSIIFPTTRHADRVKLYAKWSGNKSEFSDDGKFPLPLNQSIDFGTFFNSFSHRKWCDITGLNDISLEFIGEGDVEITIFSVMQWGEKKEIDSGRITLSKNPALMPLGNPALIMGEILSFEIKARQDGAFLSHVAWITNQKARRKVKLAAVVTTFNRLEAAKSAATKFSSEVVKDTGSVDAQLFLIDNGQNLSLPDMPNIKVLQNPNIGGAGGFTRGLAEVQQDGNFTHVLFMDDDASCEPESIWRTVAMLSRTLNPQTAISGAMFHTSDPCFQYEKGARFAVNHWDNYIWHTQHANKNMDNLAAVASNDIVDYANYGAWWFFAFALSSVKNYAFPFFVRGDDVDFSLTHGFPIVTLNGVASWCDDFAEKLNPPTEYLSWRSWLALTFMHSDARKQKKVLRETFNTALRLGYRFDYAGMQAILDAIETVFEGPTAFADNPSPLNKISEAKKRIKTLVLTPELLKTIEPYQRSPRSRDRYFLSILTLGGHLIPDAFLWRKPQHVPIAWQAGRESLVEMKYVVFGRGDRIEARERNNADFFSALGRLCKLYVRALYQHKAVAQKYRDLSMQYRSLDYWKKHFITNNEINLSSSLEN